MAVKRDVAGHGDMRGQMDFLRTTGAGEFFDMLHQQTAETLALGGRVDGDVHQMCGGIGQT